MRIVLVHDYYDRSAPSGENSGYSLEVALLRNKGHSVEEFTVDNARLRRNARSLLLTALKAPWNCESMRRLGEVCRRFMPDIVHVHNTFPLLSPSVFYSARACGAAVVHTLHNYRPYCASGRFTRDGHPCQL